jgi:CHASE2 domain-containing sensor protein
VIVACIYSLLFISGFFRTWQDRSSDSLFLSRKPLQDIVIIAIDDTSIQKIGRFPWSRAVHAELIEKLGTRPIVIGYDVSFPEPSNASDDARLAAAIAGTRKTVLPLEAGTVSFDGRVTQMKRIL